MFRSPIITAAIALMLVPAGAHADTPPQPSDETPVIEPVLAASTAVVGERSALPGTSAKDEPTALLELAKRLDELRASGPLAGGVTALYVMDARTGTLLYAADAETSINPASNVKLIATAATLDVFGPEWRYVTRVLGPRPTADGVIDGDIYIHGHWDPTLTDTRVRAMARELLDAGVTRVNGTIYVGQGTAIPRARSSERESVSSPRVRLHVQAGKRPGDVPTFELSPALDFIDVEMQATTVARSRGRNRVELTIDSSLVTDERGHTRWRLVVSGRIPAKRRAQYRRRCPDGGLFTGNLLYQELADAGVVFAEDRPRVERLSLADYMSTHASSFLPGELARNESDTMAELVSVINKRSRNRLADRVLMSAGSHRYGGTPDMKKGVRLMREWLADNAPTDLERTVLDTGSGLSYRTQLTARQIAEVLRAASGLGDATNDPMNAAVFLDSLPVAGVDGTLRRRFRRSRARRHVHAKTGTLTRVISLSGIVSAGEHGHLVFAIVSNKHKRTYRRKVRERHEDMVEAMYRYLSERADER